MKVQIDDKEFTCFLEHEKIIERCKELGQQMSEDLKDSVPVFIGVLNGSFLFLADLMKEVSIPAEVSFIKVSSYNGQTASSGAVKSLIGLSEAIKGRDVVLVEDIIDTGITLTFLVEEVSKMQPASLRVCSLLFKPEALKRDIGKVDYVGFEIPNEFVVGYGLDYKELGRNLKDIYRFVQ